MPTILEKIKNIPRIDYINYLILLYALTLSFPSEIKRVVAILMIILWLTDRTKYDFKLPKTNIFLLFGIFIAYSLLSYFWSDVTVKEAFEYIRRYWYYLPIFIIFKYLKKEFFEYVISFFLLGMFISEILSYGNFFKFWEIGLGYTSNPTVFIHHTTYSVFLAITSIFLLAKIFNEKSRNKKILYCIFFISITINLLVNSGRTGYFSFFITIIILSFYIFKMKIKYIIFTVITTITIISLAYTQSPNFKTRINLIKNDIDGVIINNDYSSAIGARIGLWIIAKDLIISNPLLGTGVSSSLKEKNNIINNDSNTNNFDYIQTLHSFHNIYLEILIQYGIIGLTIFLLIILEILKIHLKNIEIDILKITTILVYFLGSFTDILFHLKDSITFFSFIIGIVLAKYKIEYQNPT